MTTRIGGDGPSKVREWIESGVDETVNTIKRRLLLTSHRNLIAPPQNGGTPIDTGRARMGWTPSAGAPSRYEPPEEGGRPQSRPDALVPAAGDLEVGEDLFETNLVPYIGVLNRGHSPQAAPDFIPAAVKAAIRETGGQS